MSEVSQPSVCPCGRLHRPQDARPRRKPRPANHGELAARIYDAKMKGNTAPGARPGEWFVNYAGNCEDPAGPIRRIADSGALLADMYVRCRRCKSCLRARMGYWLRAAAHWTEATMEAGLRTWFGTLTLRPEARAVTLAVAREEWAQAASSSAIPDWWDEPACNERFRLHRKVLVRELQKYFKRLRKAGHRFKYIAVFERHESGWPHIHWLLHELGAKIRHTDLAHQWALGFVKIKLVGGWDRKRRRTLSPVYAAHYVTKYLAKEYQARQLASLGYARYTSISHGSEERT